MLQLFQKAGDRGESNAIDKGLSCVCEPKLNAVATKVYAARCSIEPLAPVWGRNVPGTSDRMTIKNTPK